MATPAQQQRNRPRKFGFENIDICCDPRYEAKQRQAVLKWTRREREEQAMVERIKPHVTLDALLAFDEDSFAEVVDGELAYKDMNAGFLHVVVIENLKDALKPTIKHHRLGWLLGDGLTYVLHIDDQSVRTSRIPDMSFVRHGKLPTDFNPNRPFFGAPALAVEVVSPTEQAPDTLGKVRDFLRYGSEQVWVLYPAQRELHVHLPDNTPPRVYNSDTPFSPAELFPDVTIAIAALFGTDAD